MANPGPTTSLLHPSSPRTSTPSPDLGLYTSRPEDDNESMGPSDNEPNCFPNLIRLLFGPWKTLFYALCCCNGPGPGGGSSSNGSTRANSPQQENTSSYSFPVMSLTSLRPSLFAHLLSCPPFSTGVVSPPDSPLLTNEPDGYFSRPRRNTPTYNPAGDTPGSYYTTDSPQSPPNPNHPYYQHYHPHSSAFYTQDPEQLTPGLTSHFLPGTYTAGTSAAGTRANTSANTSGQTSQTDLLVMYGHGYDAGSQQMIYRRIVDSRGGHRGRGGGSGSFSGHTTGAGSIRSRRGMGMMMGGGFGSSPRPMDPSTSVTTAETARREDRERAYDGDYDGEDVTGSSTVPSSEDGDIDADYDQPSYSAQYNTHHRHACRRRLVWAGSDEDEEEYDVDYDENEYDNATNPIDDERPLLARRGAGLMIINSMDGTTPTDTRQQQQQQLSNRPPTVRSYGSNDNTPRPGVGMRMGMMVTANASTAGISELNLPGTGVDIG